MSILHYVQRPGFFPGIPGEVGAGQIIETEDDGTTIIAIRSLGDTAAGETEKAEGLEVESAAPQTLEGAETTTKAGRKRAAGATEAETPVAG